jgi:DNA-binding response OmpR family regulator
VEAIRRGVDNYLIKPFERVNLVRKIHETMKGVREGSRRIRRPEAPPAKEDSVR